MIGFDMNQFVAPAWLGEPVRSSGAEEMGERNSAFSQTVSLSPAGEREEIDGLEFLNRIKAGRHPPPAMMVLLGMDVAEIERGRVVFEAVPTAAHYNPAGAVHGGFAATLLDSCMTCAVQSTLAAGQNRQDWPETSVCFRSSDHLGDLAIFFSICLKRPFRE